MLTELVPETQLTQLSQTDAKLVVLKPKAPRLRLSGNGERHTNVHDIKYYVIK